MDVDRVEAVVGLKKPWSSHTEEHLIGQLSVQFLQPYSQHYPKVSVFGHAWASEVLCQDTQARTTSIPDKPPRSALKKTASLSSNNALSAFFFKFTGKYTVKGQAQTADKRKKSFFRRAAGLCMLDSPCKDHIQESRWTRPTQLTAFPLQPNYITAKN